MKKLWYAVQNDPTDEWGTGSFDYDEAYEMAKRFDCELIAVIDADYDEEGNPTKEPVCVDEIYIIQDI